ncbi:hypothetical protein B566_EDAN014352 [Ephemera danica]|nr:hypothetical protein B566_EDAN014352 [Ephemera danica]
MVFCILRNFQVPFYCYCYAITLSQCMLF